MHPPIPVADPWSEPFWEAARHESLSIQRCVVCRRFQMPPAAFCLDCHSTDLSFEAVSGRGKIKTFTVVHSGARQDYFEQNSPYVVAIVELDEQPDLYLYSNMPGSTPADLAPGMDVEVTFQMIEEGVVIPQFRVASAGSGSVR